LSRGLQEEVLLGVSSRSWRETTFDRSE